MVLRQRIYNGREEIVHLCWPLFIFFLALAEGTWSPVWVRAHTHEIRSVLAALFITNGHAFLSFTLLWLTPQGRNWQQQTKGLGPLPFPMAHVFLLFWFTILSLGTFAPFSAALPTEYGSWFVSGVHILVFHHSVWQVFGIAQIYRPGSSANGPHFEKLFFHGIVVCNILETFSLRLSSAPALTFIVSTGLAIGIVCRSAWLFGWKSHRTLFLARLLLYPFYGQSLFVALLVGPLHGVEYVHITRKMAKNCDFSPTHQRKFWVVSVFGMAVMTFAIAMKPELLGQYFFGPSLPPTLAVIVSLFMGISLTHFWIDSRLFKMKDPVTRQQIAPLLA